MSEIYLISDQHYKHQEICQYTERPFKLVKEMNKTMIDRHNSFVSPEDIVYHLGDFCFTSGWQDVKNILNKLNGTHHLIMGNHDRLNVFDYVEAGFQSVHTSLMLDGYLLIHDPAVAGCFENINVIHGHVHNLALRLSKNTWNVSVEVQNYTPINLKYIKDNW